MCECVFPHLVSFFFGRCFAIEFLLRYANIHGYILGCYFQRCNKNREIERSAAGKQAQTYNTANLTMHRLQHEIQSERY